MLVVPVVLDFEEHTHTHTHSLAFFSIRVAVGGEGREEMKNAGGKGTTDTKERE